MIYLVYRMHLSTKARRDSKAFWAWLEDREKWFYKDLPMVKEVRWYYSVIGDVYTLENWAALEDEAALGDYRKALTELRMNDAWEAERVTQEEWWEFLDTRLVADPPADVGFSRDSK